MRTRFCLPAIVIVLAGLPMPANAETPDAFHAGWSYVHKSECADLGLIAGSNSPFSPVIEGERFLAGYRAAYVDVFESMSADGIADGLKAWCANPWEYYPEYLPGRLPPNYPKPQE